MTESQKKSPRRSWERKETVAFLQAYSARREEFNDTRKKKYAMSNVLEDLISQGVLKQPTTVGMLIIKLKNLLRAYKSSKDNNKRTGSSPCVVPFEDILDEIFGDKPIISNAHTINLHGERVEPLSVESSASNISLELEEVIVLDGAPATVSCQTVSCAEPKNKTNNRLTARQKYFKAKINLKKELAQEKILIFKQYTEAKLRKMDEGEKAKERRHSEKLSVLKEITEIYKC